MASDAAELSWFCGYDGNADYTAVSPEGKRNCKNGPTRRPQASSLCSAPGITSKCSSRPSCQPFSARTSRSFSTFSTLRPPSFVPTSNQIPVSYTHLDVYKRQLQERPEKDRTLADYKQTVAAYQRVYLITPQAEEVTPALIAEAELYQQMARQFDEKYFQSAIDTYNFLLKQYPETRYRSEAIFSIAQIQKDDLGRPEVAEVTFKDFLKRFPKSEKAPKARQALKEISDSRERANNKPPEIKGQVVQQRESAHGTPHVTDVHAWNSETYTRIIAVSYTHLPPPRSRCPLLRRRRARRNGTRHDGIRPPRPPIKIPRRSIPVSYTHLMPSWIWLRCFMQLPYITTKTDCLHPSFFASVRLSRNRD